MINAKSKAPKLKLFGLVRDKHGRPKIDDPDNLPEEIRALLTEEERREIYGES